MALLVIGLFLFIVGYGIYAEIKNDNKQRADFMKKVERAKSRKRS